MDTQDHDEHKRLTARVFGQVHGVGFRRFAEQRARRLGLKGWVRNCADGSVETVAEGPARKLEAYLGVLRQGPSAARVERVESDWSNAEGEWTGFSIRY